MAAVKPVERVKLFSGIISSSEGVLDQVSSELEAIGGPIDSKSEIIPFSFTSYYAGEMGESLLRVFVSFSRLIDPSDIVDIKLATNAIEERHAAVREGIRCRTVNLDPGYLNASRLVLATTKDFSHRLYLGRGIYGEITLNFGKNGFIAHPWTYPDFQSARYQDFFSRLRSAYLAERA